MSRKTSRGSKPNDYQGPDDGQRDESAGVKFWRNRINAARRALDLDYRINRAVQGNQYLDGTHKTKNGRVIYLRYLLPLLEELHRSTVAEMPHVQVEARSEQGDKYADKARELLDLCFSRPECNVRRVCEDAQWDDDRSGVAFVKTVWTTQTKPVESFAPGSDEEMGIQVERAEAENLDPLKSQVGEGDIHAIHLPLHDDVLAQTPVTDSRWYALWQHIQDHRAGLTEVTVEYPSVVRVRWNRFTYDTQERWEERNWEAEERSERVRDLLNQGYRNVNSENCPPEVHNDDHGNRPYEDCTVRIYDIHDRRNGKRYVVPVDGPPIGKFLFQGEWPYGGMDIYLKLVMRPDDPDFSYGVSTIDGALPILDVLASVDYYIKRHVEEHANYKLIGPKGAASNEVKQAISDPNVRFVDAPPEWMAGMKEYKPPAVPDALLQQRAELLSELRRWIGADAQDTGADYVHQITATESAARSKAGGDRRNARQQTMGGFLESIGRNFLKLYKKFGTLQLRVRLLGQGPALAAGPQVAVTPAGVTYDFIKPDDLPEDIEVYVNLYSTTPGAKADKLAGWNQFISLRRNIVAAGVPTDWDKLSEDYGRELDIKHPETYRGQVPQVPGAVGPMPGVPGITQQPQSQPQASGGFVPPQPQQMGSMV